MKTATLRTLGLACALLALFVVTPAFAQQDLWLHVRVDSKADGENVRVNLPLSLVASILPKIEATPHLQGGKVRINEALEGQNIDIRGIWNDLRNAADGDYVTVDGPDEKVKVRKSQGMFLVDVDGASSNGTPGEKVRVKLPLKVLDALFSAGNDEIDIIAAINALGEFENQDLVTVEEENETVRIWVDRVQEAP